MDDPITSAIIARAVLREYQGHHPRTELEFAMIAYHAYGGLEGKLE